MMEVLTHDPTLSLWLVAPVEAPHCAEAAGRYSEAGSLQKIHYEPLSVTQELVLEKTFAEAGIGAPTVEQALATYKKIERDVPLYAFEVSGEIWHLRNQSRPSFGHPLLGRKWVLSAKTFESETKRIELDGSEVEGALAWLRLPLPPLPSRGARAVPSPAKRSRPLLARSRARTPHDGTKTSRSRGRQRKICRRASRSSFRSSS